LPATNTKAKKPRHSLANDKRFLELGRRHFAEDFPNPSRKGCPPDEALSKLAFHPGHVDDTVLDHISFCSPCYRIFSRFLRRLKAKGSTRKAHRSAKP
jgi:hypothetical protein